MEKIEIEIEDLINLLINFGCKCRNSVWNEREGYWSNNKIEEKVKIIIYDLIYEKDSDT